MAELKTKKGTGSVTAFLKKIKDDDVRKDCESLVRLFKGVTKKQPALWSNGTIGFGTYYYKSDRSSQEGEWYLTGFAPRKGNITIYIMVGLKKNTALLKKLGTHTLSGGSCIYIKKLADINTTVLRKLIKDSVAQMKHQYQVN